MLLENINLELATLSAGVFGLVLTLFILLVKNKENSRYVSFPASEEVKKEPVKLELVEFEEEDDDDVDTEIINTLDYHQVPKEIIAERARKLATGGN